MEDEAPTSFVIAHDDYHAEYAGSLQDGRQFFLTAPFLAAADGPDSGCEFLALYIFDSDGLLQDATIESFGPRAHLDEERRRARRDELLAALGDFEFGDIAIAPFSVSRFGTNFGFVPHPPDEEIEDWFITIEPGDYMCFYPPWDSGEYDT
jgi:hypothetical protein